MSTTVGRKYLDPKVLDRISRLDIRARLVVEGYISGQHMSPYHGFAIEFASHREYVPGDEIKHIDWKVWSKTDRIFIKEYEEETNLKCTMILDASKSMKYGSDAEGLSKFDYAATIAACLGQVLQMQADAVGLVTFDTKIRRNVPPGSSISHRKLLLHELEQTTVDNKTDLGVVFKDLAQQIRSRGIVVLISDLFVDPETLRESVRQFRHKRHEVVVFHVMHDHELNFPFQDNTLFKGLEVDTELHTEPRALRKAYLENVAAFLQKTRKMCVSSGCDYMLLNTAEPLDAALSKYLAFRQRLRRIKQR